MLLCFIMNEDRNIWFIARILTQWTSHFIIGLFRQSSSIIPVYPPLGACGGNVFRHLLVQHGAAPLGYPAHYWLIMNQDHLSHVNLLLLLGWIDRKID
jgi:hypothetical protein